VEELLLNLVWMALSITLFVVCVRHRRTGRGAQPLVVVIGCILLIALILFPAISATDDLASVGLEMEHPRARFIALQAALHQQGTAAPLANLMLLAAVSLALCALLSRYAQALLQQKALTFGVVRGRPQAVRPPPAAAAL
jgi:xanthine/uracil permease